MKFTHTKIRFLPNEEKTIRAWELPGVIGGAKYIVHNILFKFAVDHRHFHGSDWIAAKIAGHEMKGLQVKQNISFLSNILF
jgi:hypothetical protein